MTGTGALIGFSRTIDLPIAIGIRTAPRVPGERLQSFPWDMWNMLGQITKDIDFDLLREVARAQNGFSSLGHTTLTRLTDGRWNADSFFDLIYSLTLLVSRVVY